MSRTLSFLNLAYRFNLHMLKKPFVAGRKGKERFIENYREDNIFPLDEALREQLPEVDSCINCGLCDTICRQLPARQRHLFGGPSELAISLGRDLPATHLLEEYLRLWDECGDCKDCVNICPAGVPLRELGTFTRAVQAAALRGRGATGQ